MASNSISSVSSTRLMNESTAQNSKTISSLHSRRVSVIKWIGKEMNFEKFSTEKWLSISALSTSKENFTSSSSDSIGEKTVFAEKYRCLFCGKSFKWRSHWKSHERTHTGERPFKCEICGKAFTRSDGLQSHKVNHLAQNGSSGRVSTKDGRERGDHTQSIQLLNAKHPEWSKHTEDIAGQLFSCYICERVFLSSVGLVKHLHAHKGKSEHKCDVCNRIFTKRSALETHRRVHTGDKPYSCNICKKSFSIHGNLKRHLLIHTGEKPYKCLECSNCFSSPSHLKRHLNTKHNIVYSSFAESIVQHHS